MAAFFNRETMRRTEIEPVGKDEATGLPIFPAKAKMEPLFPHETTKAGDWLQVEGPALETPHYENRVEVYADHVRVYRAGAQVAASTAHVDRMGWVNLSPMPTPANEKEANVLQIPSHVQGLMVEGYKFWLDQGGRIYQQIDRS